MRRKSVATSEGMLVEKMAFSPSSSTSQPMTPSESGQVYSPEAPKRVAVALGREDCTGRAIAEQGGGHDIAFAEVVLAEGQRAQFDDEEENALAGHGAGQIGCARQADDAAGAAQAEHRQALDVAAHRHALDQARVEAGGGDAGGRGDDDGVDIAGLEPGLFQQRGGDGLQQRDRIVDVERGAFAPAVILLVPVDGHAGIARLDAGVLEDGQQAVDVAAPAEQMGGPGGDLFLSEAEGRDGAFQGQQARAHRYVLILAGANPLPRIHAFVLRERPACGSDAPGVDRRGPGAYFAAVRDPQKSKENGPVSAEKPAQLVLLRHGESEWNKRNLFTGWRDVKLTAQGESEARNAGTLLREAGFRFDIAFTSLQTRAIKTLWLALEEMDQMWIEEIKHWRLNERHYGALTGQDKKEAVETFGAEQVHLWRRSYDVPPPPVDLDSPDYPRHDPRYAGVADADLPRGECLKDVLDRVMPYWEPDHRAAAQGRQDGADRRPRQFAPRTAQASGRGSATMPSPRSIFRQACPRPITSMPR